MNLVNTNSSQPIFIHSQNNICTKIYLYTYTNTQKLNQIVISIIYTIKAATIIYSKNLQKTKQTNLK